MWFRGVVTRLSQAWRTRLFDAFRASVEIPNHIVKLGRQQARLSELGCAQLQRSSRVDPSGAIRPDVELLVTIGQVWGKTRSPAVPFPRDGRATRGFRVCGLAARHPSEALTDAGGLDAEHAPEILRRGDSSTSRHKSAVARERGPLASAERHSVLYAAAETLDQFQSRPTAGAH